jgi:hypothetical protein
MRCRFWEWVAGALVLVLPAMTFAGETSFDFAGNLSATTGVGTLGFASDTGSVAQFGTTDSFGLPALNNGDQTVLYMPHFADNTRGLLLNNNSPANGPEGSGFTRINNYTVVFDMLVPNTSAYWGGLYNTSPTNTNDADFFVRPPGGAIPTGSVGTNSDYYGTINNGTWYRVAQTLESWGTQATTDARTRIGTYVNGVQVYTVDCYAKQVWPAGYRRDNAAGLDGRWTLSPTDPAWLFADESGETNDLYVANFSVFDHTLTVNEMKALGSTAALPGDANIDNTVNVADLTNLLNNYNKSGMVWGDGDFTHDGTVNVADLTLLLNNYNKTSGGVVAAGNAVPEPSTIAMLVGIALTALLYGWRKRA